MAAIARTRGTFRDTLFVQLPPPEATRYIYIALQSTRTRAALEGTVTAVYALHQRTDTHIYPANKLILL